MQGGGPDGGEGEMDEKRRGMEEGEMVDLWGKGREGEGKKE